MLRDIERCVCVCVVRCARMLFWLIALVNWCAFLFASRLFVRSFICFISSSASTHKKRDERNDDDDGCGICCWLVGLHKHKYILLLSGSCVRLLFLFRGGVVGSIFFHEGVFRVGVDRTHGTATSHMGTQIEDKDTKKRNITLTHKCIRFFVVGRLVGWLVEYGYLAFAIVVMG